MPLQGIHDPSLACMEWGQTVSPDSSEKDGAVYKTQVGYFTRHHADNSMVKLEGYDKAKIKLAGRYGMMRKMRDYMPQEKETHYDQKK